MPCKNVDFRNNHLFIVYVVCKKNKALDYVILLLLFFGRGLHQKYLYDISRAKISAFPILLALTSSIDRQPKLVIFSRYVFFFSLFGRLFVGKLTLRFLDISEV